LPTSGSSLGHSARLRSSERIQVDADLQARAGNGAQNVVVLMGCLSVDLTARLSAAAECIYGR